MRGKSHLASEDRGNRFERHARREKGQLPGRSRSQDAAVSGRVGAGGADLFRHPAGGGKNRLVGALEDLPFRNQSHQAHLGQDGSSHTL